ncbi:MAG: helix-hairpin-helix domain-containing protein [Proteobacteria bacterium]|nr:helix-hairpin-helix domain-containing protein [Pseudomonadota bacterium]
MMRTPNRASQLAAALALCLVCLQAPSVWANEPVVNVNTATVDQLETLPGVGESRARAIIAARRERGGFKAVDELGDVKGIGETLLRKLRPLVTVGSKP